MPAWRHLEGTSLPVDDHSGRYTTVDAMVLELLLSSGDGEASDRRLDAYAVLFGLGYSREGCRALALDVLTHGDDLALEVMTDALGRQDIRTDDVLLVAKAMVAPARLLEAIESLPVSWSPDERRELIAALAQLVAARGRIPEPGRRQPRSGSTR